MHTRQVAISWAGQHGLWMTLVKISTAGWEVAACRHQVGLEPQSQSPVLFCFCLDKSYGLQALSSPQQPRDNTQQLL